MRVITGSARGRVLRNPSGRAVRPTSDRVKEALFSVLESHYEIGGARLLDLFAGSGALGIEALSRGAEAVVFVEPNRAARATVEENLRRCGLDGPAARVLAVPAERALRRLAEEHARFDGVFLDPPYGSGLADMALKWLGEGELLRPVAWVAVEHSRRDAPDESYGKLHLTGVRRYGTTCLTWFGTEE